jgi:hypothetical protein
VVFLGAGAVDRGRTNGWCSSRIFLGFPFLGGHEVGKASIRTSSLLPSEKNFLPMGVWAPGGDVVQQHSTLRVEILMG